MASRLPLQPNRTLHFGFLTSSLDRNLSGTIASSLQFRLKVTCHPFSWMPARRGRVLKAARFKNLRHIILNTSAAHLNEDLLSGTERGDKPRRKLNVDTVLVVSEGICITVAAAACIASVTVHGSQDSRLVVSSALEPLMARKANLPIWQSCFLLAALVINAILRSRQWQGSERSRSLTSKLVVADSSVEERVQKLEEDIGSAVTIIRVLSKQLEKLAVRFRVTRQTLRDPIQETALLAQKTSESVNILAAREDALEKSLEEIHHALMGMQENQTKQLELISALGKLVKGRPRDVEKHIKAGRNDHARMGLQPGRRARVSDNDGALQNKIVQKLGGFMGKKTDSALQSSDKILDDRSLDSSVAQVKTQGKQPVSVLTSPSKPNTLSGNAERVDFWLSTPTSTSTQKVDEPISDSKFRDRLSNDGRSRSTFLDPTTEPSFCHNDVRE
eukprot:c14248_g1_i1 orf=422-1759(-)